MKQETKISILLVRSVALVFYTARILTTLWGWYLVPMGMPKITYLYAVGVVLIGSLFYPTDYKRQWDTREGRGFWVAILNRFASVTVVFILGWIVHLFL